VSFRLKRFSPILALLSAANIVAVWYAASHAEPWHAAFHATLGVGFGLWAQYLGSVMRDGGE
jgi:hypothetical protein